MTADIDEFETAAGDFLLADPVRNTVMLTVVASLKTSGTDAYGDAPPTFGWYADSEVRSAFLRTPPMPAIMTDGPADAVRELVEVLDGAPGLHSPTTTARAFAQAWHAANGHTPKAASHRRLFRLADLTPPQPAPKGRARLVTNADRDLLVAWFSAFGIDVGEPIADAARAVDRRLENGELLLWELDGVPVSMAGATRPIAGVTRVGPVYTPTPLRGRGYAAAVTAEISRRALDAGLEVILFTDLANPTSNALYQRLGYRPIGDWTELEFA
ncbi:GNAT family N-acetyltransferase [Catenulispora rubra]|uniref:GNAT family N-acetyltransferase n=1 Tax=Catenulispora rubra TaxID=280293 RepID=UPI002B26E5A7|nr:GNAT family N-acetyltransferase [Catenulispora rubra]